MIAASRRPAHRAGLGVEAVAFEDLPRVLPGGVRVLHSIPPAGRPDLRGLLGDRAVRLVYLSSTAVYGAAGVVDENTPADPSHERLRDEREAADGPWSTLILRPAAIYGPGRGVHASVLRGEHWWGDNFVSRIHVDDLAAHAVAGLRSDAIGAYPVADEEPATSREVGLFAARLLNLEPMIENASAPRRRTGNRRVDGSAIRRILGITLAYPSFRTGIPAAIQAAKQV